MRNRYTILLLLLGVCMGPLIQATEQVLLPVSSEKMLQCVSHVYLGLDDGGSGDDTYYIHENGTQSGTAGSVDNALPFDYGDAALHRKFYYSSFGGYTLHSCKRNYGLGPTTSAQSAYAIKTGNCLLYLHTLSSSTAEKARFTISAQLGNGTTYYLSRTKNAVKWYTDVPKDQVALQKNVTSIDMASAWTFYIVPMTEAQDVTSTFDCGAFGTIEGQQPFKYENMTGVPWPTVQADKQHLFMGWYDNPEGTGEEYIATHSVCQNYYVPETSTTLYAQYLSAMADSIRVVGWTAHSLGIEYMGQAASVSVRYASPQEDCGDLLHGGYSKEQKYVLSDRVVDQSIYDLPVSTTLAYMAGQHVIMMFYNASDEPMGFVRVVVPDLLQGSVSSDGIVTDHVVLLDGSTLTLNGDMQVSSLTIEGGAKLVVPEDKHLTVDSLVMRAGAVRDEQYHYAYPQMVVNGSISTPKDTIYYDYLLNSEQYYGLAMPCEVLTRQIGYMDGQPATYGLQTYNGYQRYTTGHGWQTIAPDTLYPGRGYVIYAIPQQKGGVYRNYSRVRFPMYAALQMGEETGTGRGYRSVEVKAHGYSPAAKRPNDVGWNLVGNPYLANYSQLAGLDGMNDVALLELDTTGYHWVDTHRYVVLPNADGSGYLSQQQSKTCMMAFQPFFVQIGDGDSLRFNLINRAQHSPARHTADSAALKNAKQQAKKLAEDGQFAYWDLDKANCTTGSVTNPFETQYNKVDFGYDDPRSRHTVHYIDELDSCTGYQLHTTLPDGRPSVRLGNVDWTKSSPYSGGECVQYEYQVTVDNSILILYYAAVLQVPDHKAGKPHFSLDIMQRTGGGTYYSIGADCYSFDFTKDEISDWNCGSWKHKFLGKSQENDSVCWKDWTAISINLSDYVGQTVYIRLSTQDCNKYGHFGYAYFGIDVAKCDVQLESCGTVGEKSTLAAPDHFLYEWYRTNAPGVILSTERTIEVDNDGAEYRCKVMNIENRDCYFYIQRQAIPNVPIANFDIDHRRGECVDTLILINRSYVSSTPAGLDTLPAQCESATWTITDPLHRVSVYNTFVPDTLYLVAGGLYTISMVASWSENMCESDVKEKTLVVHAGKQTLPVKDTICEGEFIEHGLQRHYTTGYYIDTIPSGLGECHDTIIYQGYLHVHPVSVMPVEERVVCKGEYIMWQGMPYSEPGTYYDTLVNQYGCDSILGMHLRYSVHGVAHGSPLSGPKRIRRAAVPAIPQCWQDPYTLTIDSAELCHSVSYMWHDSTYLAEGDYHKVLINQYGCDSLAFLNLKQLYSVADEYDTICNTKLPYVWYGKEAQDGDTAMLINGAGCDSIVTLHLVIHKAGSSEQWVTICDTELPYLWKGQQYTTTGDYQFDTLTTLGCDSTITLHLTVHPSGSSEQWVTICDTELPYLWKGQQYTTTGDYQFDTLTTHGCDSTMMLHLIVHPSGTSEQWVTICDTETPYLWKGRQFTSTGTYTFDTLTTHGCDSIITLHLTVYPTGSSQQTVTLCDQATYLWKGQVYTQSGTYTYDTLTKHGCDSTITLYLELNYSGTSEQQVTICDTELPYLWKGQQYTTTGDYQFDTLTTRGCDSTITLHLTVSPPKQTYTKDTVVCDTLLPILWRGHTYAEPGRNVDIYRNIQGCDSVEYIYRLDTVHCEPPCLTNLMYKKRHDLIFCDNGRRQFVAFQWYRNGQMLSGETKQYYYCEQGIDAAEYFVEVTYTNGMIRHTCPEIFTEMTRSADTYVHVQTSVKRGENMHIQMSDAAADVTIISMVGQVLMQTQIKGSEVYLNIPLPSGVYVLQLKGSSVHTTTKIMVE